MSKVYKPVCFGSIISFLLLSLYSVAWAEPLSLSPYPHSSLDNTAQIINEDYLIINSAPRRVRNELRVENERRVNVEGNRQTYRVNEGHTSEQAFDYYLSELKTLGAELVYQCASRDCGRSSSWSESVYKMSKLYGKDGSQFYLSAKVMLDRSEWLVTAYAVERGNRRVYIHVETLKVVGAENSSFVPQAGGASPKGVAQPFSKLNLVYTVDVEIVDGVKVDFNEADSEKLTAQLKTSSTHSLYLVGHVNSGYSSIHDALALSKEAADTLAALLEKHGVASKRINTVGVGPFASSEKPGNRVEIIVVGD